MKIGPRKQTDQGGILTMPLRQNVSWPTDKTWQLATCPSCGRECWDRPLPEGFPEDFFSGKLRTLCALKMSNRQEAI